MSASNILAVSDDSFRHRVFLPPSEAVRCPPFTTEQHQQSALVREVLDSFLHTPTVARPVPDYDGGESVTLFGSTIENRRRVAGKTVSMRRVVAALAEPELAVIDSVPFARDESLRTAAGEALQRMSTSRVRARARPVVAPAASRAVWMVPVVLCLIAAGVVAARLLR